MNFPVLLLLHLLTPNVLYKFVLINYDTSSFHPQSHKSRYIGFEGVPVGLILSSNDLILIIAAKLYQGASPHTTVIS